ncbi:MAG: hypothetical protein DMG49_00655 [Acidobacteria bacterium]|nr:MAG: hypothetical protein DMG49_00655 [Acidobacteriota bacterium]
MPRYGHRCALRRGRIRSRSPGDGISCRPACCHEPPVTVSTGTAVYPRDGKTIDELLAAADQILYRKKGHSKKKLHQRT